MTDPTLEQLGINKLTKTWCGLLVAEVSLPKILGPDGRPAEEMMNDYSAWPPSICGTPIKWVEKLDEDAQNPAYHQHVCVTFWPTRPGLLDFLKPKEN